jgi:hypothetical protein
MPDAFSFLHDKPCSDSKRDRREALHRKWRRAVAAYENAGQPFGASTRAVEVWIEYGRQSTAN